MPGRFLGVMVPDTPHTCATPKADPELGTVWLCDCGKAYQYQADNTDYGHDVQPGDTLRPRWRLLTPDEFRRLVPVH